MRVLRSLNQGESFDEFILDDPTCVCCHTKAVTGPSGEVYFSWRSVDLSTEEQGSSAYRFDSRREADTARNIVVARTLDGGIGNKYSKPRRIPAEH